jgi:hypothetical protein
MQHSHWHFASLSVKAVRCKQAIFALRFLAAITIMCVMEQIRRLTGL